MALLNLERGQCVAYKKSLLKYNFLLSHATNIIQIVYSSLVLFTSLSNVILAFQQTNKQQKQWTIRFAFFPKKFKHDYLK